MNCAARVYLREVTAILAGSIKIRVGIDAVADVCAGRGNRIIVKVCSCKRSFDALRAICFDTYARDSDPG